MNWLNKIFKVKNPFKTKLVICFNIEGCMAHIHNFYCIGYVINEYFSESGVDMYDIKVLKRNESGDVRDEDLGTEKVYQIQKLCFNLYAFYK